MRISDRQVIELVRAGADGEAALIQLLSETKDPRCVAALGETTGPFGEELLRAIAADHARSDYERQTALVALAKRVGTRGSDCFSERLSDRRAAVKDYAALCLAAFGDDRAWEAMLARLKTLLAKPVGQPAYSHDLSAQPPALVTIGYLARHAGGAERANAAITVIRRSWAKLRPEEQDWIREYWPAVPPGAPRTLANGRAARQDFAEWVHDPLFDRLYSGDSPLFGGGA